jgi:hypothetical protein
VKIIKKNSGIELLVGDGSQHLWLPLQTLGFNPSVHRRFGNVEVQAVSDIKKTETYVFSRRKLNFCPSQVISFSWF